MAKLSNLGPLVQPLRPVLSYGDDHSGTHKSRDQAQHWRRWYKTADWQRLRWSVLSRDLFTCRRCGRIEADTSQLVADHIDPHRGDRAKFWDADNLQCLCAPCHNGAKQAEEKSIGRRWPGRGWSAPS